MVPFDRHNCAEVDWFKAKTLRYRKISMRDHILSYLPDAGKVWFSLNDTTYQNNSLVSLDDIGENDTALLCKTNFTACCWQPETDSNWLVPGNWFFPNKTEVPNVVANETIDLTWDFYRDRDQFVVRMNRRRGGEKGIYRCEISDSTNITQTIYIGVYNI